MTCFSNFKLIMSWAQFVSDMFTTTKPFDKLLIVKPRKIKH